jgi:CDP-glycerol glycerophosphotransferase (TagB/SpsB family)
MSAKPYQWNKQKNLKTVLYAPTFSPSLTSAVTLFNTIKALSSSADYQWLVKFHPKMNRDWVNQYKSIESDYIHVVEDADIVPVLHAADVLVSDTSSVITEFALLNKPIVTFNNHSPEDHLIDIQHEEQLQQGIEEALSGNLALRDKVQHNVQAMHPYSDGQSSARLINATLSILENGGGSLNKKPTNVIRSLKQRRKLNYWKV